MTTDQCPSTIGKIDPPASADTQALAQPAGERVWRSLDEYSQAPVFREFVEREFPKGASELLEQSRRTFVKLMGASLALAGAAALPGCRRPDHKILTYSSEVPEEIVIGMPLYYATSMPIPGGGAYGLLVETHEGRPTKIEGNPLHPTNRGKADATTLASILGMYDPDRLKYPVYHHPNPSRGKLEATWDDFGEWMKNEFTAVHDKDHGEGLVVIVDDVDSPTRTAVRKRFMKRFPKATWVFHNAVADRNAIEGSRIAFNEPMHERLSLDKAKVIVSFDRALISGEGESVAHERGIGPMRRPMSSTDPMSRIYCFESGFSSLGGIADHRLALSPQQISTLAVQLARKLVDMGVIRNRNVIAGALAAVDMPDTSAFEQIPTASGKGFIEELATDLMADGHRGHSLLVAGPSQPPAIHALIHAMNDMLGNVGTTVRYAKRQSPGASDLADVAAKIHAGSVKTLVCINTNPAYDAPASLNFSELMAAVPHSVTLSVGQSETAEASTWSLNAAHLLESWGDSRAFDGTVAPTQPMIAPLYSPAMSEIEFVALLAGDEAPDGFDLVRSAWSTQLGMNAGDDRFEKSWRRALHDGMLAGTSRDAAGTDINGGGVAQALTRLKLGGAPTAQALEVSFRVGMLGDGRDANNSWLQELPDPITKVVWDNPALVSPNTAKALGLSAYDNPSKVYTKDQEPKARMARLTIGERSIEIPVWVVPGLADNTVSVALGYGRTAAGLVGNKVGFDIGAVRPGFGFAATGATLERVSGTYPISSTQNHWSLEGRTAVARSLDYQTYQEHAAKAEHAGHAKVDDPFVTSTVGYKGKLHLGEQLGELAHTPANVSAYKNPQNDSMGNAGEGSVFSKGPQWGMVIDMAACTGCNACTIACQSENNIVVVGKDEVAKGREMQWIRVDRYFVGDDANAPTKMINQPVACVHCENAPCEVVCPFNATVHDREGLNVMAYNRCVGTRYCANNCPYKVRRFNFFDWGQSKFNGGLDPRFTTEELADKLTPKLQENNQKFNQNFIPPRLRAKLDEITKMQKNPDVTIRPRGVMEKCSYCIQRINRARHETKIQDLDGIPDGFFQVACEQACPTDAITFGNILDESSKVFSKRENQRGYLLLGYLNTRPRTSHLLHLTNPNPEIRAVEVPEALKHGGGGETGGEGHARLFRNDPSKRDEDPGYALSLNILGAPA